MNWNLFIRKFCLKPTAMQNSTNAPVEIETTGEGWGIMEALSVASKHSRNVLLQDM